MAVNGVWAVTAPGSYMYIHVHIGGVAAVNRDGRVIHRKRSGGGSYSQLTIGTWKRRQARAGLTTCTYRRYTVGGHTK